MTGRPSGWTPERSALAEKLYDEGLSAAEIAKKVGGGISRNAVIGRIHRIKKAAGKPLRPAPARD